MIVLNRSTLTLMTQVQTMLQIVVLILLPKVMSILIKADS